MNWTLSTAVNQSTAVRRPSGEIAAACARPPIVAPASASTTAAVNDTIIFFIRFSPLGLQGRTYPRNTNVHGKFQIAAVSRANGRLTSSAQSWQWVEKI
jgi:hypothetical protein